MNLDFVAMVDLLGFVQGTLLGIILIASYRRNSAIPWLGVFLFGYSIELVLAILSETGFLENHTEYWFVPIRFYWLFMPALFLYAKGITANIDWKKDYWHLVPGGLEFIFFTVLCFFPKDLKIQLAENGWVDGIHLLSSAVLILTYCVIIIRYIQKHKKRVDNFYSSPQDKTLKWVQWICYYVLFTLLIIPVGGFIESPFMDKVIYPAFSAVNVIFIFWVALNGFRQMLLNLPIDTFEEELQVETFSKEIEVERLPTGETEEKVRHYEILLDFMNEEEPFKDPHLHLSDLAEQLQTSHRELSHLINEHAGVNFSQFINGYRVEASKKLMLDPSKNHLTLLGIAFEVGFNSKTNFYTSFKQITGMTPRQYKQSREN